jgi:hypothetical protein
MVATAGESISINRGLSTRTKPFCLFLKKKKKKKILPKALALKTNLKKKRPNINKR